MIKNSIDKRQSWIVLSEVYFCCVIPAAYLLPAWIGWENGFLENLQVLILLVGCGVNLNFYRKRQSESGRLWLGGAGFFALLAARELSWGRVFFPVGLTETGPVFLSMNRMPHNELINLTIAAYSIAVLLLIATYFPWRRFIGGIPFPVKDLAMIIFGAGLAHVGERTAAFPEAIGQLIEELAEVAVYIWLVKLSSYYHYWLENDAKDSLIAVDLLESVADNK